MNRKTNIERKLGKLDPYFLVITDNSAAHVGHIGNPNGETESHFQIEIAARKLQGLTRIEQHRVIHDILKEEFDTGLHAVELKVKTTLT